MLPTRLSDLPLHNEQMSEIAMQRSVKVTNVQLFTMIVGRKSRSLLGRSQINMASTNMMLGAVSEIYFRNNL